MSRLDSESTSATERPRRRSHKGGVNGQPKVSRGASAQTSGPGSQTATLIRTGAAALRFIGSTVQQQLAEMSRKLERFDATMQAVELDPNKVRPTRLGGRHESTFKSQAFQRFKGLILQRGGNVQPILVREVPGFGYEIVFGHRRHRACLELGLTVQAVVWKGELSDAELFAVMDAENRGRQDPSTFDQGVMYSAALGAGLYPSQRRLAEAIGVSHTWVRKAILVATLPESVVNAFDEPCLIQPAHAQQVVAALEVDREAVLKRAAALSSSGAVRKATEVVDELLARVPREKTATPLIYGQRVLGSWVRDAKGRAVTTFEAEISTPALMKQLEVMLGLALATGQVET